MSTTNYSSIIKELNKNGETYKMLLNGLSPEQYLWKPESSRWCLLEILCHLYDEEREDFRIRTKHVLETPNNPLPPIDPEAWVEDRRYIEKEYDEVLKLFLSERAKSIQWLESLSSPSWNNAYQHPKFGPMTASMFLSNWLAHDYLHIRQIIKLKMDLLKQSTKETLLYAGEW